MANARKYGAYAKYVPNNQADQKKRRFKQKAKQRRKGS